MHFHLVYIHGFQGDHTTFQGFPTDLQTHLQATIPQSSGITVQTSIYPTYKSVKPISYAAKNFLEWLATQPPGPVILLGHSMGGLLAADAAMDSKNNPSGYPGTKPNRIVGVIAFDTPYLGMHPHVVISGIASLFPDHENNKDTKSEKELNNKEKVKMVDERVTDDWDAFKQRYEDHHLQAGSASQSQSSSHSTLSIPPSPTPTPSITSSPSPAPPSPIPSPQPNRSFFAKAQTFLATHSNDPIVRWARKHADDPYGASKRWVTERFQFGSCMFDPSGLKDRYAKLVAWNGLWCNYWTETLVKKESDHEQDREREQKDEGVEPVEPGAEGGQLEIEEDDHERKTEDKKKEKKSKDKEKKKKKPKSGRHFVVLPNGLGDLLGGMQKWDKVTIAGVEDEVAAHCGLFIKNQNLEYEGLVERVGQRVIDWCEQVKARG